MSSAAVALLPALVALAVYLPALGNGFVFDDHLYLEQLGAVRAGLSVAGLRWALTSLDAVNWHPLTWLSHMLDVRLFGARPAGHHAVNLALHALNSALVFALLARATGRRAPALAVALLFAVHPLHVESVAWVAERKDLLSSALALAALAAYLRHARRPAARSFVPVLALYVAALLAKPMVVTFPVLLLVLDAWPLGRLRRPGDPRAAAAWRACLAEKAVLLAPALAAGALTLAAQRGAGAVGTLAEFPAGVRGATAAVVVARQLGALAWPSGLAVYYPHPGRVPDGALAAAALVAALTGLAVALARSRPYLAAGWAWFVVGLLPVSGLFQTGWQLGADRYAYLPLLGIGVAVAWGFDDRRTPRPLRLAAAALAVPALLALALVTRSLLPFWHDDLALFGRAVAVTDGNWMARNNLGTALLRAGRPAEAEREYRAALAIAPDYAAAHFNLANLLAERGAVEEAGRHAAAAARLTGGGGRPGAGRVP
jgi:tetratricopeptide (TPR) repeat protein